jgi:Na+:H+ antiporter
MDHLQQLAIIWSGVYVAFYLAKKTKLTPVLFYLAVGSILVNIGVLPEESDPFIRGFSEIGIILIMFALGFEETTENFLQSIKRSWGIALFGALAPFLTAYSVAEYFWDDRSLSIMFALAMTATAVSLTMVSLKEAGLQKSAAATGIMTSAVLDDIGSLVFVAILVPMATGNGPITALDTGMIIGKAILFFVLITFLGSILFPKSSGRWQKRLPILNAFNVNKLLSLGEGEQATLTVLTIALVVGIMAYKFGFHPAVGAYMAGLIFKEEYFLVAESTASNRFHETKRIIDNVAFTWIGPVFFVELGAKIVFEPTIFFAVIPQTIILTVGLIFAQVSSAALAARYTGHFKSHEALMIGFGMLGRAELAFVVMDIAYVQNQILDEAAFYTLMFSAFWLNVSVPLTISWWRPYYDGEKTFNLFKGDGRSGPGP